MVRGFTAFHCQDRWTCLKEGSTTFRLFGARNGPTFAQRCSIFGDFYVESSSHYSLVHILPTSSSEHAVLQHFQVHFQKCSERISFLTFWHANWAPATVLCTLPTTFPDRAAIPRKHTSTPNATLPQKTQNFVPERVFIRESTRSRSVSLLYAAFTHEWCWHDGKIMPWLPLDIRP
jgi:hypothetical protein